MRQVDLVWLSCGGCGDGLFLRSTQRAVLAGEVLEDFAGQVALEAADDLAVRRAGPA
jgi:hypothetical protein